MKAPDLETLWEMVKPVKGEKPYTTGTVDRVKKYCKEHGMLDFYEHWNNDSTIPMRPNRKQLERWYRTNFSKLAQILKGADDV